MEIILRQAKIIDPQSTHHLAIRDVHLKNGRIVSIAKSIEAGKIQEVRVKGALLSKGWLDMRARTCDPGYEYKEDLASFTAAAAAGGFTRVSTLPDTNPIVQDKSGVEYIRNRSAQYPVELLPLGAVSQNLKGLEITEMFDMHQAGAPAFTNAGKMMQSGSMQRALLYIKSFNSLLCILPQEETLSANGQMHEGKQSTMLGLKGIPSHAESIAVQRDLELLRYTDSRLHFSLISTKESLELIRRAKKDGLNVTCDTAAHYLIFTDEDLEEYDTNLKVMPPLRSNDHVKALKKAVLDGTIDVIVSDHHPEDIEHKQVEFDYASPGIIGLQTSYAALNKALADKLSDERLVELLANSPKQILGVEEDSIEEGATVSLSLFTRDGETLLDTNSNKSRSVNTPYWKQSLPGRVIGIYSKGKWVSNE